MGIRHPELATAPGVTDGVLVISPRYANDVAMSVRAAGMVPRVERLATEALARCRNDGMRIVVVDARGALAQGLEIASALGAEIGRIRGGMLVLLSHSNSADAALARAAGATSVLVSPFNSDAFGIALRLTARNADIAVTPTSSLSSAEALLLRDPLTGLATGDQLQDWMTAQQKSGQPMLALTLGIGRIGAINAAYGRNVADEALRAVAIRLSSIVNDRFAGTGMQWLVARLAAAEFAIGVTGDLAAADVDPLTVSLVTAFSTPFNVAGREIHLSIRIGVAGTHSGDIDSAELLIRQAGAALATARSGDPGAVSTFSEDSHGNALLRMADLVADLYRAIDTEEITLLFQPVLDLASGRIASVEALVRWEHRVFGLLDAETLLETAAIAELDVKLGRHIRARAMREVLSWPSALAGLGLALNVTAADLADPGFVEALGDALQTSGFPYRRLTLEITEGALIDKIADAALIFERLRDSGVRIVLDDFGTGFSSLAWLARLPIDGIKLDSSFTKAMCGTERERIVVETVVALARRMGLTVVAEGVEETIQLAAALTAGCDAVQGFEIAMPLAGQSLIDFCDAWVVRPGGKGN
jgi:EAL domain-containing protein (putative c-di-GMP-specific phosphodiesterase class I)/GGDEF domain-containing protein